MKVCKVVTICSKTATVRHMIINDRVLSTISGAVRMSPNQKDAEKTLSSRLFPAEYKFVDRTWPPN